MINRVIKFGDGAKKKAVTILKEIEDRQRRLYLFDL